MLKALAIVTLCVTACGSCASEQLGARDPLPEQSEDALAGFHVKKTDCPFLFIAAANARLWQLMDSVSVGERMDYKTFEHSPDGKQARVWDTQASIYRDKATVIEAGRPPRLLETPRGAFLDREGKVVFTVDRPENKPFTLHFPGNTVIETIDFRADYDGRYICIPGNGSAAGDVAVTIRSTLDPEQVLATTRIKGNLWKIFVVKGKLYVFLRGSSTFPAQNPMLCEIYRQEGNAIVLERGCEILAPTSWWTRNMTGALWTLADDISPDGKHLLVIQNQDFGQTRYYLYDLETGKFINLGYLDGYSLTCFLDPDILKPK